MYVDIYGIGKISDFEIFVKVKVVFDFCLGMMGKVFDFKCGGNKCY